MLALENILEMLPDRMGEKKDSQIFTPAHIAREMIEALPCDIWNKDTTFLDPICKSGIFLYEIYQKLMKTEKLVKDFPDEIRRREHIINNQLFGIAIDQTCQMFSIRTVGGYLAEKNNIILIEDYQTILKSSERRVLLEKIQKEFGTVKFDVVIGNPPYNNDIYLDFVELGCTLSNKYNLMITPAKWQAKGGEHNEKFRKSIVPYMREIVFYPDTIDIFNIAMPCGISYYVIDKEIHQEKRIKNVSKRIRDFNNIEFRQIGSVLNNITYKIADRLKDKDKLQINTDSSFFGLGTTGTLAGGNVAVISNNKVAGYCSMHDIRKNKNCVDKYKLTVNEMGGFCLFYDNNGSTLGYNRVTIVSKGQVTPQHYMVVGCSDDVNKLLSIQSYFNSKLFRFLFVTSMSGQTLSEKNAYRFIPALPVHKLDHIYTDQELYDLFDLSSEEVQIIESVIKER